MPYLEEGAQRTFQRRGGGGRNRTRQNEDYTVPGYGTDDPNQGYIKLGDDGPIKGDQQESPPQAEQTITTAGDAPPTLQDLYPNPVEISRPDVPVIDQPTGARLTRANKAFADIEAQQSTKSEDQNADFELNRMMAQDNPLMERAKQEAMQQANRRGLQNTSIAVGSAQGAMVDRMMPMALQNSAQNYGRENLNTQFRQQSQELEAQLKVAMEQGDQAAATQIAMQKAELDRNWQIQVADQEFKANQQAADAQNRQDEQTQEQINELNGQLLVGQQQLDLAVHNNAHELLLNNNDSARAYNTAFQTGVAAILANSDMSPAEQASAIEQLIKARDASFETLLVFEETPVDDEPGAAPPGQDIV